MRKSRRLLLLAMGAVALGGLALLVWQSGYWVTAPDDVGWRIFWWVIGWIVLGVNGVGLVAIIAGAVVGGIGYGLVVALSWAATGKPHAIFDWAGGRLKKHIVEPLTDWWCSEKPPEAVTIQPIETPDADEVEALAELDEQFPGVILKEGW